MWQKKLEANLSKQHAKHLGTHDKTWKSYKLCDNFEESIKHDSKEMETKEDDNNDDEDEDDFS